MKKIISRIRSANAFTLFLVKAFVFYIAWWFAYNYYVSPRTNIDNTVIANQVKTSGYLLDTFGYDVRYRTKNPQEKPDMLWIHGSKHALKVEQACDSVDLMGLFAVFIFAYPGRWLHRSWFIPLGIILIHFMNIIRIISLCIIEYKNHELLDFNHKYTFTGIMYVFIFGLWYTWVKYYSNKN